MRIPLPKAGLRSRDLTVDIQKNHLKAAIKNQLPAIVDDRLQHDVKIEESTWLIEDKQTLLITLEKVGLHFPLDFFFSNTSALDLINIV